MRADFRLEDWIVRPRLDCIERGDETVHIHPKPMAVLECLAAAGGEVVTRDELFEHVWPDVIVTDDTLTQSIVELRKAFGDSPRDHRIIKTIPKVGFCLVPPVTLLSAEKETLAQRKAGNRVKLTVIAVFLALTIIWVWWPAETPVTTKPQVSIAVLPFTDMSKDQDQEYFADGVSEELSNGLARVEGLRVTGRTSSFYFKGRNEDLRVIGEMLGVSHVLEGSVRKDGENLRITAQLVDTADGFHLWSDTYDYDRELTNDLAVQERISGAVVSALEKELELQLGPVSQGVGTFSSEAHDAFLRGKYLLAQRTVDALEGAVYEFEKAIEIDPDYAIAHAELSMSIFLYKYYAGTLGKRKDKDKKSRTLIHAERAMELNPNLAEAHAAMARVQKTREDRLKYYEQAIEINPNYSIVYTWMGDPLKLLGRYKEVFTTHQAGLLLDPMSIPGIGQYVDDLIERQQLDEAAMELERLAYLKPELYVRMKGKLAGEGGKWANWALGALDGMLIKPGSPISRNILAGRFAIMGLEREALSIRTPPKVFTLMVLGRHEEALDRAQERVNRKPENNRARSYLGRALAINDEYVLARPILEEAWENNGHRVTRSETFAPGDAATLVAILRAAGEEAKVVELLAAMQDNVRRLKEAGIIRAGSFVSTDFVEGLTLYMSNEQERGLALIAKAVENGYFIPPAKFYPQALYDEPGFAPIRALQEANQARERNRFLDIVCTDNPYQEVWQPEEGTCEQLWLVDGG
jgi:TolB-like protein/DNA-binding winged helix-turn-helix (wHTH) protein